MKKVLIAVVLLVLAAAMLFVGCSPANSVESSGEYYAEEPVYDSVEEGVMAPQEMPAVDDAAYDKEVLEEEMQSDGSAGGVVIDNNAGTSILEPSVNRKIIFSGSIAARTKDFDKDYDNIFAKVKEAGGYVEYSNVYGTKPQGYQDPGRTADITIRVPSNKFDPFIKMLEGIGETTGSSVNGQDISLQYYDVETRLETLRIREDRLQELLAKSATLEDIIELERELANVSYEIQSNEITLRNFDSLVDFSTISISLQEVQEQDEIIPAEKTLGERISNAFYSVINGLAEFFRGFIVVFVAALPIILILGAILAIVLVSVHVSKKRKKAKLEKLNKENK